MWWCRGGKYPGRNSNMKNGSGLGHVDVIMRFKKLLFVLLLIHSKASRCQRPWVKLLSSPRLAVPWGSEVLVMWPHLTHSCWSLFPSASPVCVCWWLTQFWLVECYLYGAFIPERYGHWDWQLFSISTWKILITKPHGFCSYCWEITHQSACYVSVVICLSLFAFDSSANSWRVWLPFLWIGTPSVSRCQNC